MRLQKSGGCEGCPDACAHSAQQLSADGYVDFIPGVDQRLYAGLSADLSSSTASTTMGYAFSFWAGGVWEIRELGVYKGEGTFAAGNHFSISVESGVVVYRHNGVAVYRSAAAPGFPMALDTTFYSIGSSLSGATVGSGLPPNSTAAPPPSTTTTVASTQTTTSTTNPSGLPTRTAVGPYFAVTDRYTFPEARATGDRAGRDDDSGSRVRIIDYTRHRRKHPSWLSESLVPHAVRYTPARLERRRHEVLCRQHRRDHHPVRLRSGDTQRETDPADDHR